MRRNESARAPAMKFLSRRSVLLLGCALTFGLCILSFAASGASLVTVEAIGGESGGAFLERQGKKSVLHQGEALLEGDRIETGTQTAVDIRLADESLIRVGVNSSFRLEKDKQGFFQRLLGGITRVLVPETKSGSGVRFRLSTPAGTIGVRGTEFIVQHKDKITTVYGLKGEVLVGAKNDFSDLTKFMVVMKGYASEIKEGGSMPAKPNRYDPSDLLKKVNTDSFAPLASREAGGVIKRSSSGGSAVVAAPQKQKMESSSFAEEGIVSKQIGGGSSGPGMVSEGDANQQLIDAVMSGNVDRIKAAIAAGAQVSQAKVGASGDGVLHIAAVADRLEAIQFLVDFAGVPVNVVNALGQTPLMRAAAEAEREDTILLLLQNGADINRKDKNGLTAIDYARQNKNVKTMAAFLQKYLQK